MSSRKLTRIEQLDERLASKDDPGVIAYIGEWREELKAEEQDPTSLRRFWGELTTHTSSAELVIALVSLTWGAMLVADPRMYDRAPELYAGNAAWAPEAAWGSPLLVGALFVILGVASGKKQLRIHGLALQFFVWFGAAIAQAFADAFSGTPAVMALVIAFFVIVKPKA